MLHKTFMRSDTAMRNTTSSLATKLTSRKAATLLLALAGVIGGAAGAQVVAAPGTAPMQPKPVAQLTAYTGPKYNNRYELFGGLSFMNGQAGQNLQSKYNMGGGEGQFTYWLGKGPVSRLGVLGDYRFEAGTTPTIPNPGNAQNVHLNRVLVMQHVFSGGVVYRGFKNRYFAIDYHAQAGASHGIFDHATQNYPGGSPVSACPAQQTAGQTGNLGLYCNSTAPWGAVGGSIDFNQSSRFAVRLSPDMIFEHFGTETREYFSLGGGILWRFGAR
ncbi:hypothetical protein SAMN05421819_1544 [Bryocella elongata]|uniref:Outer membrane protein beta-barrel domain-containing protein n=1 Tax=Bryocella elongata TaxID=863522 RepID=A0A1H5WE98_9BACT|nr:hypothetical protein [Bryocella elongata]SEF97792.1 hypothetical protein SAMN05421819_1544 [Bryocella elongata]